MESQEVSIPQKSSEPISTSKTEEESFMRHFKEHNQRLDTPEKKIIYYKQVLKQLDKEKFTKKITHSFTLLPKSLLRQFQGLRVMDEEIANDTNNLIHLISWYIKTSAVTESLEQVLSNSHQNSKPDEKILERKRTNIVYI